jgi:Flp pilus assembly protein CpaB
MGGGGLAEFRAELSDLVHAHRRLLATVLVAVAAAGVLTSHHHSPGPTRAVWVASHDLKGGAPLRRSDLRLAEFPPALAPADAVPAATPPVGRLLAAAMRRGEPITDVRLLSTGLLAGSGNASDVAVPVRVSDGPAALALVHPGEAVDVIASEDVAGTGMTASAGPVVEDVRVLAVPAHLSSDDAGLIIVAATEAQATALAEIPAGDRVSIAVRRQP